LAANNGDTLVEAVISATKKQIQIRGAKIIPTQKQQPGNRINIIINQIFQQFLKDEN
jgi:hypothetical protein